MCFHELTTISLAAGLLAGAAAILVDELYAG
jgi:hypothetical protein